MKKYEEFTDEQLIEMLRDGEQEIADYLVDKYKNLVRKKARALYLAGGDQEDLLQEGMLGLFKAVQEYQTDKDAVFYTFASSCITNQMYKAVTSSRRQKHQPLNNSLSLNELEENTGWNLITENSPEKILLEQERSAHLNDRIESMLSTFEKQVLEMYLDGDNYIRIGERLNKSPKSIDNALQRIRKKVRETLGTSES
ncbi:MAG TPA: sigma-70 family RNA polymerase sigma factor [Candidatus Pelethocola excrementipullorum]|nr:sigma-70 family RNA polymerase sigma factor [Candidatus Pelethocola excrementipullorum]